MSAVNVAGDRERPERRSGEIQAHDQAHDQAHERLLRALPAGAASVSSDCGPKTMPEIPSNEHAPNIKMTTIGL
jgi:hypothetical protein